MDGSSHMTLICWSSVGAMCTSTSARKQGSLLSKEGLKIAVEIKSFTGRSEVTDLERALGQYTLYRFLMGRQDPSRTLYLAVTLDIYEDFFTETVVRDLIGETDLRLVIIDPMKEEVIRWIP